MFNCLKIIFKKSYRYFIMLYYIKIPLSWNIKLWNELDHLSKGPKKCLKTTFK